MFRPMRREKQALPREDCLRVLSEEKRGVLSVIGDEGYPYGTPINQYYCPEDGKLYFHGGKIGHRVDAMKACDKACFTIYDGGCPEVGGWALNYRCVIAFGRLEVVEDEAWALEIARRLSHKFTDDEHYIDEEVRRSGKGTLVFALTIEHMTGKRINEK